MTYAPSCVTRYPCSFAVKLPARVYWKDVGTAGGAPPVPTRNQPSPWTARSSALPVVCSAPPCMRLSIEPSCTPRPTWRALEPPWTAFGAEEPDCICESESLKVVRPDLKPVVLTLAMLFDVTSSIVWWDFSPLMAENMLRSIGRFLPLDYWTAVTESGLIPVTPPTVREGWWSFHSTRSTDPVAAAPLTSV